MGNGQPSTNIRDAPSYVGDAGSPFENSTSPTSTQQEASGESSRGDAGTDSNSNRAPLIELPVAPDRITPRQDYPNIDVRVDAERAKTILEGIASLGVVFG